MATGSAGGLLLPYFPHRSTDLRDDEFRLEMAGFNTK